MRIVKSLTVIGLAAYLVLQGIYYVAMIDSPAMPLVTGIVGLATGVLMFISLSHWIEHKG